LSIILFVLTAVTCAVHAQSGAQKETEKVPVIDGGAGPCVLDLTVVGTDGKPVYGATVKVHIAYGFGGFRKLDLQAGTNSDGKVKFTGLPDRVRRPPLEFEGFKDDLQGIATDDPSAECQAKHELRLTKPPAPPPQ
jgi:hypothetical protein